MSRLRTFAAFTALAAVICLGFGAASTDGKASGTDRWPNSGRTVGDAQSDNNRMAAGLSY